MGNMELSKDNVDNIIKAFKIVSDKYKDIELHLYGAPSTSDQKKIITLIEKLGLRERVIFKGKAYNKDVPVILSNSFLLVSSQPNTKRAEGGFPTKLGEYMATGVPLLLTDVGEIGKYIADGVNGWLVPPGDPIKYAEKANYIIENYQQALDVAENAKNYIANNFDCKIQGIRLKKFLDDLN